MENIVVPLTKFSSLYLQQWGLKVLKHMHTLSFSVEENIEERKETGKEIEMCVEVYQPSVT